MSKLRDEVHSLVRLRRCSLWIEEGYTHRIEDHILGLSAR
jgi:hypothetical protein